jgi:hypothetical protein
VHEKELLAIVRALKKWRIELLGAPILVHTDHHTLENVNTQKELSRCQARWSEYMSQFNLSFTYIKGEDNKAADALSRLHPEHDENISIACVTNIASRLTDSCFSQGDVSMNAVFNIQHDRQLTLDILNGYMEDSYCRKLFTALDSLPGLTECDGLLYLSGPLIIPRVKSLQEQLFHLAHDALGHCGADKAYLALRQSFYWPNMHCDLMEKYIPSCVECLRNKSPTTVPAGPLHLLPVPDKHGDSIAIDFIGLLPDDQGHNTIISITDRLNADLRIIPCRDHISMEYFALLFFDNWYCENGLPLEIISDHDKLFISHFWHILHKLTGVKLKLSSVYYPQTNGASERTNKSISQAIRFYVERNQMGWVKALPAVHFNFINTINSSTGFSPFQLHIGYSPRLVSPISLTPITNNDVMDSDEERARNLIACLKLDVMEAQDNLVTAKAAQSYHTNKHRSSELQLQVGDRVMLSTKHRCCEYMQKASGRAAKFMPHFDGPYTILEAHPDTSTYTLDLPNLPNIFPTFCASQLRRYTQNDTKLFPRCELPQPGPVVTQDGQLENFIEQIFNERKVGRRKKYLVCWVDYGAEDAEWLPHRELDDCEALDRWEKKKIA